MDGAQELLRLFDTLTTSDHDTLVAQFSKVLRIETGVAQFFLESSKWNVEAAINMFLSTAGSRGNLLTVQQAPSGVLTCEPTFANGTSKHAPRTQLTVMVHLKNNGKVKWPSTAVLRFADGQRVATATSLRVPQLDPGQEQFFALRVTCPAAPGTVASCWRLAYAGGYMSEAMWMMFSVDASLAATPSAAPAVTFGGATTAGPAAAALRSHDLAVAMMGTPGSDVGMGGGDDDDAMSPGGAIFAPTSFSSGYAAPAPAPAAPAPAPAPSGTPSFTFTGFRTTADDPGAGGGFAGFGAAFGSTGFGSAVPAPGAPAAPAPAGGFAGFGAAAPAPAPGPAMAGWGAPAPAPASDDMSDL